MLVLSRKENQVIELKTPGGEYIKVVVVEIVDGKVRLGFAAPKSVTIHRREVWQQIASQQAATGGNRRQREGQGGMTP